MRRLTGAVAALLLLALSFTVSALAAGPGTCAHAPAVTADASLQADDAVNAGAFIKPEAAPQSLAERPQESPNLMTGTAGLGRRDSGPFFPTHLLYKEPAPSSASARCAHLQVYRL